MALAKVCRTGLAIAASTVLAASLWVGGAWAAPRRTFDVPAEPLTRALLDFAIQANLSIGAGEAAGCRSPSRGVTGQFTVAEALNRILAGTGCSYRMVDAASVRIVRPATATAAGRPQPAAAQPAPPPSAGPPMGEVVVTATRRGALTLRLPDAIRTVTGARMAEYRDSSIGDLAGWTAGLTVTNLGPGSDKIIIRGLSDSGLTGHAQSTVGIYLDDTRLTFNAPDPDLRLTDIDRVEVMQGPQGALYGAGSIAGLVHIVTRRPELNQFDGEISVTGSGTVGGGPSGVVEGAVNAPLIPGRLAVRAAAYSEHDSGYIDDVSLRRNGTNATDRNGFRLVAELAPADDWTADLGATRQTLAAADSQYAVARLGAYQRKIALQEPHDNDFGEVHLTVQGDVTAGRLKNTLSLVRHDIDARYDASSDLPQFARTPPTAIGVFNEDDDIEAVVDEATLASAGASRFEWLLGGFLSSTHESLDSGINRLPSAAAPQTPVYIETRTDTIEEQAIYGEATYDLSPRLAIGAGARAGLTEVATDSTVRAPLTGAAAPFHGQLSGLAFEPKLSLRYQLGAQSMAYLLASEGARGGGFNTGGPIGERFSGPGGSAEPFRRFNGDELWNFEAGYKTRLLADRLDLRATAFYDVWSNVQSDELLPSGLPYTANIGDGRNIGLEAEADYDVGGLELRLNSLLDAPELIHNNTPFPSLLHSGLPGVPRGSLGAAIRYEWRTASGLRPFFDANVDYVGSSRLTFDAHTTRRMGDYTVTRMTTGVAASAWRAAAFVDNPFGVVGDTFAYGNPFTLKRSHQITPLRPRTAGLQLTRSF